MIADLEDLEKMNASDIYPRKNQRKGSIDKTKKMMNSYSQHQMVQQNSHGETTNSENPL